jgi:hypothetical protein
VDSTASGSTMEQSNRKKEGSYLPSARVEDGKPINGMRLYIEERDIYGNYDDDDLSSIGNSTRRYVDSGVSFLEDADGSRERMDILGLSEKEFTGLFVSRDSATALLDVSLIQEAPSGSQPVSCRSDGNILKGWFISHRLCIPRYIQLAPKWLKVLVLGSLMLLIVSIVVAGIALSEMNNGSSQSNPILGGAGAGPTPSPVTMGQTNAFSPTVNVRDKINESRPTANVQDQIALGEMNNDSSQGNLILVGMGAIPTPSPITLEQTNMFSPTGSVEDQINESQPAANVQDQINELQPTSSPASSPLESGANNIFSPADNVQDQIAEPPQLRDSSASSGSGSSALDKATAAADYLPPTSAPTTHPTQFPSTRPVDTTSAPSSPPSPQISTTRLPSAQPVAASSSAKASQFSSGGKRRNFFRPSN